MLKLLDAGALFGRRGLFFVRCFGSPGAAVAGSAIGATASSIATPVR
eukprot:COSAG02_NODE_68416_length_246_cov_3.496599_1_plen_46_part_01